ncbi:MAG: response regulator [Pseudomonadota bacterium]
MNATDRRPHYRDYSDLASFDPLKTPVWIFDVDRHSMWWANRSALSFWKADSIAALQARDFSTDSETVRLRLKRIVEAPDPASSVRETWTLYPDQSPVTVNLDMRPVLIAEDRNALMIEASAELDLTQNPDALRILEAARSSAILVSTFSLEGRLLTQNPAANARYAGLEPDPGQTELMGRFENPSVAEKILAAVANEGLFEGEVAVRTAAGIRIHDVIASKGRDPVSGEFVTVLNEEDRTQESRLRRELEALNNELERRVQERTEALEQANESLKTEIRERQMVEEKLRSAQKLEAIGKLTGGIAHDFNNILAVVMGNVDLLDGQSDYFDKARSAIREASERGADLTQRLLAFSRRQPLSPQSIKLSDLLEGTVEMLRRTLGETINIVVRDCADEWPIFADPGQLENAIVNIALNARDAMPDGGELAFACRKLSLPAQAPPTFEELVAGEYVVLCIADTGSGMTAEVQTQAFEPFFTTKDVGQGSGLGLSMVYGFARQSGGLARIISQSNAGTTLELILPRSEECNRAQAPAPVAAQPARGDETLLLVEDNAELLKVTQIMLEQLGYTVCGASDGEAALRLLASDQPIDLVLSDVVLPGSLSGPELINRARRHQPALKAIFVSGYPRELLVNAGFDASRDRLLTKPFRRSELSQALREALD